MGPSIKEQGSKLGNEFRFGRRKYLKAQRKKRTHSFKKIVFCFIGPNILTHKYRKCAQFMDQRIIYELNLQIKMVIEVIHRVRQNVKQIFQLRIRATTSLCFAWLEKCVSPGQWNRATTDLKANQAFVPRKRPSFFQ